MMAENYMLKETLSYPSLIREVIAPLRAQAQSVLSDEIIRNIDCIYIYGSGDSLNAAVCAAHCTVAPFLAFVRGAVVCCCRVDFMFHHHRAAPAETAFRCCCQHCGRAIWPAHTGAYTG